MDAEKLNTITIKEAKEIITKLVENFYNNKVHTVPMLWGAPGIGKSDIIKQICEEKELSFLDVRLSMVEPVDIRGFPVVRGNITEWIRPEFVPSEGKGILFLDEITTAPQNVQNAALQLILDRTVGRHKLGDGWFIVCAGNSKQHKAFVNNLSAPLLNRLVNLYVEPNLDDFIEYGLKKKFQPEIISFLKFRPELLYGNPEYNKPFPTPRSWEKLSELKNMWNYDSVVFGLIGNASVEFKAYLNNYKGIEGIIDKALKTGKVNWDKLDLDKKYAFCASLIYRVNEENIKNVMEIILNLKEEEFSAFIAKGIAQRGLYELIENSGKEYMERFITKFSDLML